MEVPEQLSLGVIAYYTFAVTLLVVYVTGMFLAGARRELAYGAYGALMLLLISCMDGTVSFLLGFDNWLMTDAPLFIGAVTAAFGFIHVGLRLQAGHWLFRTRSIMFALGGLALALIPAYWLTDVGPLFALLNVLLVLMVFAQAFAANSGATYMLGRFQATRVLPVVLGLTLVLLYGVDLSGGNFSRATVDQINRALILAHLVHVMLIASVLVIAQVRAKDAAELNALRESRRAAEASLALERSQRDFERAQRLARDRSRQLASASHDIKQPIAALRAALPSSADDASGVSSNQVRRLQDAINYLDGLAGTYLTSGTDGMDAHHAESGVAPVSQGREQDDPDVEEVAAALIVRTVATLFEEEARAQGVLLRHRAVDAVARVNPLALTRSLSNLVSNALAHARCSRLMVVARYDRAGVRFEVRDNGIGMSTSEAEAALQLRARGEQSSGAGLGLAIVGALAEEQGWEFKLLTQPKLGTRITLTVPAGLHIE